MQETNVVRLLHITDSHISLSNDVGLLNVGLCGESKD
jgi:hypothetical protein